MIHILTFIGGGVFALVGNAIFGKTVVGKIKAELVVLKTDLLTEFAKLTGTGSK